MIFCKGLVPRSERARAQLVNGVIISANFHELLMSEIQMIGNDPRSSLRLGASAIIYSPTIKLAELTIAGK
jgi:hypothetical protein